MKVHIRTTCSFCDGVVYLPVCETASCTDKRYTQHGRCAYCQDRDQILSVVKSTNNHYETIPFEMVR